MYGHLAILLTGLQNVSCFYVQSSVYIVIVVIVMFVNVMYIVILAAAIFVGICYQLYYLSLTTNIMVKL